MVRQAGRFRSPLWLVAALSALALLRPPLAAEVVLNEVLASNLSVNFDDEGDAEDWVELLNLGGAEVDLEGHFLSDDPVLLEKWQFPQVSIPAGGRLLVWLSGKNRFVPPPSALSGSANVAFEASLVRDGDEWRYLLGDPGSIGPPAGWSGPGFDDSDWPLGRAGFGYGDGDDATVIPAGSGVVFIRRRFSVPDPRALANLVLEVDYDDGFIAYLNGVRVAAANGPAGEPSFASLSTGSREAGSAELFDLTTQLALLAPGENVLAIVGLNTNLESSDLTLRPRLGSVPNVLHANFKVERAGEFLGLSGPDGALLDSVVLPPQTQDHSYGRSPDGTGAWFYFLSPTPSSANVSRPYDVPLADSIAFSPTPGVYASGGIPVRLSAGNFELTRIHYTTDGSTPTPASPLYSGSIEVASSTCFRAAGFIDGERATRVVSGSYFLNVGLSLPILSITIDPADFTQVQTDNAASGRGSEREGFFEFIEQGRRVVATGFGLRLHGGAGRNGDFNTKKAYKAYFRSAYGARKLEYPIIPETPVVEFDKLVLRSGFNDCFRTNGRAAYIRDELIRDLHEDMGALVSHGSWCVLFVNGRIRGLYNIVERMDEEFFASYLDEKDWDVIKTGNDVLAGTNESWQSLRNFAVSNDLAGDVPYQQFSKLLDLENFTSYMIVNMWAQNHDWPHNNWYAARPRADGGRWIFLSWDAEFGIGLIPAGYSSDTFEFVFTRSGYQKEIFERALANRAYRGYFIRELDRHLNGALRPDRVRARILDLRRRVEADMPVEAGLFGRTVNHWLANVAEMDQFATNRNAAFWSFVRNSSRFAFEAPTAPRLDAVAPSRIVNTGGVMVTLSGARFEADTEVAFDGIPAAVELRSAGSLLATLPFDAALSGPVAITVTNPRTLESDEAADLLEVLPPVPALEALAPAEGSSSGGDAVRIRGRYFLEGLEVRFGDRPAAGVRIIGAGASDGSIEEIEALSPPGEGTVLVSVVNHRPARLPSVEALAFRYRGAAFLRGDANGDGLVDLSDAVSVLGYLFIGDEDLPCLVAADANGSRGIDLSDAVAILEFLFQGGGPPPAPYPDCGERGAEEPLSCEQPGPCRA
jgi:hypothetical protein